YQELGFFVRWRNRWLPELGVRATRIRDRTNDIILMQPVAPGPIADFAAERNEGIVGARIQVASIDTAQDFIESATGLELQRFRTAGDIAIRIPAEATHGLILELFQARKPPRNPKHK